VQQRILRHIIEQAGVTLDELKRDHESGIQRAERATASFASAARRRVAKVGKARLAAMARMAAELTAKANRTEA
jgi:hypothetical protein